MTFPPKQTHGDIYATCEAKSNINDLNTKRNKI